MKIAVTLRVDESAAYVETRDGLDQRWWDFLKRCNLIPIVIPNNIELCKSLIEELEIEGLLLTGGNSLVKYGGSAPMRDEVERWLLNKALSKGWPVLGVCRGMQLIQDVFGIRLIGVDGHVATEGPLKVVQRKRLGKLIDDNTKVMSFHKLGAFESNLNIETVCKSEDGVIKAIQHKSEKVYGIMWHPEREGISSQQDIDIVRSVFYGCMR